ncbi:MAG: substrate-binding domain-containing protein [Phenylobacterium sp.]|uniref:substrate-binding domain-containing protein n=1 Tax=Phenylobacterium sp. TaxID=1871053 RepID=UPI0025E9A8FC|nr:substrate-binding domain-containing protein [Phenylobacterium sp.]MCA6224075.1 substrate-binding domain-containing protein [Phenylobacterium sp.]MCA6225422.1 substrate-binding domain-containing protein [Phenylobacterium sp.]MCA6233044.1 substrate-binding domain-containing protein [Phenylobacterium sp.]MCA6234974.1 substrate-binding domain-containing protein [Phenylobacterium sp.]MCA6250038.1 substrate-binding domain-containing protein [Phenylobacterium sp.]
MTQRFLPVATASLVLAAGLGAAPAHAARDYVWAAGSSTVFPFATRVSEQFARKTGMKAPKIESLGTGGGIKLFCSGVGDGFPDIATASRQMKRSEFDACAAKGVKDIIELKIGFDGIVVALDKDGPDYAFSPSTLYLGLASKVLRYGKYETNPYRTWSEVGSGLPRNRILVYGPPPSSGTRDAFVELAIEAGALRYPANKALKDKDERRFKEMVHPLRKDGWIDAGENDNAIVQTLTKTPGAIGVFGWSFLEENMDKVKGAPVNGVKPSLASISNGSYPLSRSLFIYVKKSNLGVTRGLREYVAEFVSDAATGRGGYLKDRGLIPLPAAQHEANKAAVRTLTPMGRPAA